MRMNCLFSVPISNFEPLNRVKMTMITRAVLIFLIVSISAIDNSFSVPVSGSCTSDGDCDTGLLCKTCDLNGDSQGKCTRVRPVDPKSKVKGLPFNRYSWLTTHNSYAQTGSNSETGSILLSPKNQEDTVAAQLDNGVRGLMLDMYDFKKDVWLCHSYGGKCYDYTAFKPAIGTLKDIQKFLEQNPEEIITIFIEDYVTSPLGLSKVFNASGLQKFWFPPSKMPADGKDWPSVDEMIARNQRLLVFSSNSSKEGSEGIAYQWKYVVESLYGNGGMTAGKCPNRGESASMDSKSRSLVLVNYFPDNPNMTEACSDNSAPLVDMVKTCYKVDGNRWANFVAVDFYQRSGGLGAAEAVDKANGDSACGCDSIAYCKVNGTFGSCDVPKVVASPPPIRKPTNLGSDPSTAAHLRLDRLFLFVSPFVFGTSFTIWR